MLRMGAAAAVKWLLWDTEKKKGCLYALFVSTLGRLKEACHGLPFPEGAPRGPWLVQNHPTSFMTGSPESGPHNPILTPPGANHRTLTVCPQAKHLSAMEPTSQSLFLSGAFLSSQR